MLIKLISLKKKLSTKTLINLIAKLISFCSKKLTLVHIKDFFRTNIVLFILLQNKITFLAT